MVLHEWKILSVSASACPVQINVLPPLVVKCLILAVAVCCSGVALGAEEPGLEMLADAISESAENASGVPPLRRKEFPTPGMLLDRSYYGRQRRQSASARLTRRKSDTNVSRADVRRMLKARRLSTNCFAGRVGAAGLPGLQDFVGGTSNYGLCGAPFSCGVGFGGNFIQIHSHGQGDTWSTPLDYTQTSSTSCSNFADWKVAGYTSWGIEYRTCKVTSPSSMWFAAFVSVDGKIDGFRVVDTYDASRTVFNEFDWARRRAAGPERRRRTGDVRRRFSYTEGDRRRSFDVLRRRRSPDGRVRGLSFLTYSSSTGPSVNHLIMVPDADDQWMHDPENEARVVTEEAPVTMLLVATWLGENNRLYDEVEVESLLTAVTSEWCFWTPCFPTSSTADCVEGSKIQHGGTCTVQCDSLYTCGYVPTPATVSCNKGTLTPATFGCQKDNTDCRAPLAIANAGNPTCLEGSCIGNGASCSPQCMNPYVKTEVSLNCVNGDLSPATFACYAPSCNGPMNVANAAAQSCSEGAFVTHGSTCTPACATNYLPSETSLSCSFGILTPSTFNCRAPCTAPAGISNADSPSCAEGSIILHGSTCTTSCAGLWVAFPATLSCNNGTLGTFQCLANPCNAPTGITNGSTPACAEGPVIIHGGTCTASCQNGFVPSSATLSCTHGTLTPATYTCSPAPCPAPSGIAHAATPSCSQGSSVASGSSCLAQCLTGYVPSRTSLNCSYGQLSPSTFTCLPAPCQAPAGVTFQAVQGCAEGLTINHTQTCTAQCISGYVATPTTLSCSYGVLTPSTFTCVEKPCPAPTGIDNAITPSCNEGALVNHGDNCTGRCESGYTQSVNLTCSFGVLNPPLFNCLGLPCPAPIITTPNAAAMACVEGSNIIHGEACTTQCATGYVPSVAQLNCTATLLEPSTFTCSEAPCPVPQDISNALSPPCAEGYEVASGSQCTPQCENLFTPSPTSLSCSLGVLSPVTFSCIGTPCPAPSGIANVNPVSACAQGSEIDHGSSCSAQCAVGFSPTVVSLQCNLGVLSPLTFTCVPAGCGALLGISNAKSPSCQEGNFIQHGGTCTAVCKDGYLPNNPTMSCNYGQFLPTDFVCVGIPCPAPTGVENAMDPPCLEGNLIDSGGKCRTQCETGYLPSVGQLECKLGVMNPPTFQCNEAPCFSPTGIPFAMDPSCAEPDIFHGTNCTTQCLPGYFPVPAKLSCSLGVLSPLVFECAQSPCSAPVGIANAVDPPCREGYTIESKDNCTTRCVQGYTPVPSLLECDRGELYPPVFECAGSVCVSPLMIDYEQGLACERCNEFRSASACLEGAEIPHGGVCTARCDEGYVPSLWVLQCALGRLSPPGFTCVEAVHGFDHSTQLLTACMLSDERKVNRLIAMRADLEFRGSGGSTALHLCALHGRDNSSAISVEQLLVAGANANAVDDRRWTPLHLAASRGHAASVSLLLAHGANVYARNLAGATPGDLARSLDQQALVLHGHQVSGQAEVSLLLTDAERLLSHQLCVNQHICPATVSPDVPQTRLASGANKTRLCPCPDTGLSNFSNFSLGEVVVGNYGNYVGNGTSGRENVSLCPCPDDSDVEDGLDLDPEEATAAVNIASENSTLDNLTSAAANGTSNGVIQATVVTTALAAPVSAGATTLQVADCENLQPGMQLTLSDGNNSETKTIVSVNCPGRRLASDSRRLAAGTVVIDSPLTYNYAAGTTIVAQPKASTTSTTTTIDLVNTTTLLLNTSTTAMSTNAMGHTHTTTLLFNTSTGAMGHTTTTIADITTTTSLPNTNATSIADATATTTTTITIATTTATTTSDTTTTISPSNSSTNVMTDTTTTITADAIADTTTTTTTSADTETTLQSSSSTASIADTITSVPENTSSVVDTISITDTITPIADAINASLSNGSDNGSLVELDDTKNNMSITDTITPIADAINAALSNGSDYGSLVDLDDTNNNNSNIKNNSNNDNSSNSHNTTNKINTNNINNNTNNANNTATTNNDSNSNSNNSSMAETLRNSTT